MEYRTTLEFCKGLSVSNLSIPRRGITYHMPHSGTKIQENQEMYTERWVQGMKPFPLMRLRDEIVS